MEKIILIVFYLLLQLTTTLDYEISLKEPFLLTNQNLNILAVELDYINGIYYAIFTDGSVRRYSHDLSSYAIADYQDLI